MIGTKSTNLIVNIITSHVVLRQMTKFQELYCESENAISVQNTKS